MDSEIVLTFGGYTKIPSFFNVSHSGGIKVIIKNNQIILHTNWFFKRTFSIYDVKEVLYGKTAIFEIPFVGLKVNSNGKEIIHLITSGTKLFGLENDASDKLINIFKEKVPIRKIDDKIITGKSLRKYLNN